MHAAYIFTPPPPQEGAHPSLACNVYACVQVLEHKLRALDAFLLDAADRRRARGFKADGATLVPAAPAAAGAGGGGGGLFGDGNNRLNAAAGAAMAGGFGGVGGVRGPMAQAGAPAAKRQRLWSAALYEEQRNNAIRYAVRGGGRRRATGSYKRGGGQGWDPWPCLGLPGPGPNSGQRCGSHQALAYLLPKLHYSRMLLLYSRPAGTSGEVTEQGRLERSCSSTCLFVHILQAVWHATNISQL